MPRSLCSTQAALGGGLSSSAGTPFAAMMRPRSIGTRSSTARGALAWMKASKRSASAAWMSRKKNAGAFSGSAAMNCRRRLPSISITVTSSARPRPSESTTLTVSAPGRWMLAIASRSTVERGARQTARDQHDERRDEPQHHEHRRRRRDEDRGDALVVGELDRERRERAGGEHGRHDIEPARERRVRARPRRGTAPRPTRRARVRAARARRRARSARRRASASARSPGCSAGASGNGRTDPKVQTIRNGSAAPTASPGSAPIRASASVCVR